MGLLDKAVSTLVPIDGLFKSLFDLISEAIPDPDKRAEIAFKMVELKSQLAQIVLSQTTTPKIDAFVKLMASVGTWGQVFVDLAQAILVLLRPIGSFVLTGYAMYAANSGKPLPQGLEYILAAAFPGWMTSRHINKAQEAKEETIRREAEIKEKAKVAMARSRSASELEAMMKSIKE